MGRQNDARSRVCPVGGQKKEPRGGFSRRPGRVIEARGDDLRHAEGPNEARGDDLRHAEGPIGARGDDLRRSGRMIEARSPQPQRGWIQQPRASGAPPPTQPPAPIRSPTSSRSKPPPDAIAAHAPPNPQPAQLDSGRESPRSAQSHPAEPDLPIPSPAHEPVHTRPPLHRNDLGQGTRDERLVGLSNAFFAARASHLVVSL